MVMSTSRRQRSLGLSRRMWTRVAIMKYYLKKKCEKATSRRGSLALIGRGFTLRDEISKDPKWCERKKRGTEWEQKVKWGRGSLKLRVANKYCAGESLQARYLGTDLSPKEKKNKGCAVTRSWLVCFFL